LSGQRRLPLGGILIWRRLRSNREARIVLVFSVLYILVGLGSNRLLTQLIEPEILGTYYLAMNLVVWLTLPATSAYIYVWRHWPVARANRVVKRFSRGLAWGLAGLAVVAMVGSLGMAGGGIIGWEVVPFLCLLSLGTGINQVLDQIQTLERRRVTAGVLNLLGTPARQLVLALAALVLAPTGLILLGVQAVYGLLIATLSFGLCWLVIRNTSQEPDDDAKIPEGLRRSQFLWFCCPYLATAIISQLCNTAERWGLAHSADAGTTAQFVQAVGLAMAVVTASVAPLGTYFQPLISQAASQGDSPLSQAMRPIRSYLLWVIGVLAVVATGTWLFAPYLTMILFGPAFSSVSDLLPLAVLGAGLFTLGQCVVVVPIAVRDPIGPNAAFLVSKAIYLALLVALPVSAEPAYRFCVYFAAGNAVYLAVILCVSVFWMREAAETDPKSCCQNAMTPVSLDRE
jgi:O-antigen/teichoic acid export membrane protein